MFSAKFACPISGFTIEEIEPRLFSFNSPQGACPTCDGLGTQSFFDPQLVVPDERASLPRRRRPLVRRAVALLRPDAGKPRAALQGPDRRALGRPAGQGRTAILHGSGEEVVTLRYKDGLRAYDVKKPFEGVLPNLERRHRETDNPWVREDLRATRRRSPATPAAASA